MGFEIKGVEIKDLAGISAPLQKFIEVISAGMGVLYRPRAMRNEADAKAHEIIAIAKAEAEAGVIASQGQANAQLQYIKTLAAGEQEILERARMRLIAREIEAQNNVEAIAESALKFLPEKVSDDPVSPDWRRKFFLEAENICDEDMQELWGRVLADEVAKPGSYSLRSLGVLKALSRGEAETFRLACSLACNGGEIFLNESKGPADPLKEYGLHYGALMTLTDAGLLHSPSSVRRQFQHLPDESPNWLIKNNGLYLLISGKSLKTISLPVLAFTAAGRELQQLISPSPCMPYLQDIAGFLRTRHKLTVKRGAETRQEDGSTAITFEEDF